MYSCAQLFKSVARLVVNPAALDPLLESKNAPSIPLFLQGNLEHIFEERNKLNAAGLGENLFGDIDSGLAVADPFAHIALQQQINYAPFEILAADLHEPRPDRRLFREDFGLYDFQRKLQGGRTRNADLSDHAVEGADGQLRG